MSFFPKSFYGSDASFTPLFRLLDDFDSYSREVQGTQEGRRSTRARTFSPRFDVREVEGAYELHGELPGIARENVNIEFTEPQTIVVSGRVERSYTAGTPPAGLIEDTSKKATITEEGEKTSTPPAKEKGAAEGTVNGNGNGNGGAQRAEKFWVSERSVGEFSRTFSFPTPVDHDGVTAGLNNGVLSVTIPKAKKKEARRIAIN